MTQRNRKPYSELSEAQKIKCRSRAMANIYQRRGHLSPEPCERCGAVSQKHHPDYSQPLSVRWLCRDCHLTHHEAEKMARIAELSAKCRELLKKYF